MAKESIKERLDLLRRRMETSELERQKKSVFKEHFKKIALVGTVLGGFIGYIGLNDYLIKRQDYPVRNILYGSTDTTNIFGNKDDGNSQKADRIQSIKYTSGTGAESKSGTFLFETTREVTGNKKDFSMNDSENRKVAAATEKREIFQAGIRLINGAINYREQFAQIFRSSKENAPKNYVVYKIAPERGLEEKDIDVIEQQNGTRIIVNRLIEGRSFPLGYLFGKEKFRSGTSIEDYVVGGDNDELSKDIFNKIRELDSDQSKDEAQREKIVKDIIKKEREMKNITIYSSFEDGVFKSLPTESTVYLGYTPTTLERIKNWAGFGRHDHIRLRVENQWDLWPGHYPILSSLSFGSGKNIVFPFDKYNNGGYIITDMYGEVAKIKIEDSLLKYGQDVLYKYYLDLNGDGNIEENELVGSVLCNMSHDERNSIGDLIGENDSDTDITYSINYTFMAPDSDLKKGMEYLKYSTYIESMMPDQIHRGNGRQSLLGLINDQRGDIMLFNNLKIENLSRSLTQESTLAAKYDIIKVLNAAHRPYARELAKIYGVEKDFEGQYSSSPLLREVTEIGPLPAIFLSILGAGGVYYYGKKRLNKKKETPQKRLLELREAVVTK